MDFFLLLFFNGKGKVSQREVPSLQRVKEAENNGLGREPLPESKTGDSSRNVRCSSWNWEIWKHVLSLFYFICFLFLFSFLSFSFFPFCTHSHLFFLCLFIPSFFHLPGYSFEIAMNSELWFPFFSFVKCLLQLFRPCLTTECWLCKGQITCIFQFKGF